MQSEINDFQLNISTCMEGNTNQMKKEIYANSYSSEANVPRT
jgi:hypothetical protein